MTIKLNYNQLGQSDNPYWIEVESLLKQVEITNNYYCDK